ncbi:hypothetical protein [Clavibacter sp. km1a]|uniref:hypothetical protein n=1 Tax=Clavibacter sp. km1a TaxID=3459136 RepID=UPI0040414247
MTKQDPQMTGKWFVIIGLCFCTIGGLAVLMAQPSGEAPLGDRAESAFLLGLPVGVLMILWGGVQKLRGKW